MVVPHVLKIVGEILLALNRAARDRRQRGRVDPQASGDAVGGGVGLPLVVIAGRAGNRFRLNARRLRLLDHVGQLVGNGVLGGVGAIERDRIADRKRLGPERPARLARGLTRVGLDRSEALTERRLHLASIGHRHRGIPGHRADDGVDVGGGGVMTLGFELNDPGQLGALSFGRGERLAGVRRANLG